MRHQSVCILLSPLAWTFVPSCASAQEATQVTTVSLTGALRAESNVAKANPDRALQRGLQQADQRLTVGAELSLIRPLGRNSLELTAFAGYDFYNRNARLNRERIALDADAGLYFGNCQLQLNPRFERRQSDLAQLAVLNVPGIDSVRNTQTVQNYESSLQCGRANGLKILGSAGYTQGNNSNSLRRFANYRGHQLQAGVSYQNPVLGEFTATLGRDRITYPERSGTIGLSGYRIDQLKITGRREIGAILTANASLAYSNLDPDGPAGGGFKGLTWTAGLSAVPSTDLRVTLDFARSLNPSLGGEALYSRDTSYALAAEYALTPRTSVFSGVTRNDRRFANARSTQTVLLTNDRLDQLNAGLRMQVNRRLKLSLEGGHERRNANGTFLDYRNTYGLLTASITLGNF